MLSFEEASERFRERLERRMAELVADGGLMGEMALYHLNTGGKRVRGLIPPWLVTNLGGDGWAAVDVGAAFELLHNGTLVHDDLQDNDEFRRGKPTVWKCWGAAQAINLGDAFTYLAGDCLASAQAPRGLASVAWRAMTAVAAGQILEFQLRLPPGDPDAVPATIPAFFRMARGKTGALFGACIEASALCEGSQDAEPYKAWGEQLGLLFQVQDDYLDLVGDKGRERRGSDIGEGKISYPVVWTLSHGPLATRDRLEAIIRTPRQETTDAMIDEAMELLLRGGGLEATRRLLLDEAAVLTSADISGYLPGLVDRILGPVAHAL